VLLLVLLLLVLRPAADSCRVRTARCCLQFRDQWQLSWMDLVLPQQLL